VLGFKFSASYTFLLVLKIELCRRSRPSQFFRKNVLPLFFYIIYYVVLTEYFTVKVLIKLVVFVEETVVFV